MNKISVLFVCLGNICRSPLAESIFKHKVEQHNLGAFIKADSCGTSDYHIGDQPDPRTIANAATHGLRLEHRGRQLTVNDIEDFDYILAMDKHNLENIQRLAGPKRPSNKIMLMRDFDPASKGEVPDPYHREEKDFQEVFEILDRSLDNFILHLKQNELKIKV